jgi:GH24 family phage-related lysozyme (muramidase)
VRITTSKMLRRCSRGGVPQACPTLKKWGCKDYASKEQWSSILKRSQPSQHGPGRSGDWSRRRSRLE